MKGECPMRKYGIGTRIIAAVLFYAMLLSLVPAMELGVHAYSTGDERFVAAATDGITMLNNGESVTLPIKVNNFVNDGLLFEYLSSIHGNKNAEDYLWEYTNDDVGGRSAYVQVYPYNIRSDDDFADKDGISSGMDANGCLDADGSVHSSDGYELNGTTPWSRTLTPKIWTDDNDGVYETGETPFVRLTPDGSSYGYSGKGRAWTILSQFSATNGVRAEEIRYAVVIYRLPNGPSTANDQTPTAVYSNFGLTINGFNEYEDTDGDSAVEGNLSQYVAVNTTASSNWQYAIIDLLGRTNNYRIDADAMVKDVYLQLPLHRNDTNLCMDIAAVGYFPYYGDAEQFAYYGVTLGCRQQYFYSDNAGFSLRNPERTSVTDASSWDYSVESVGDWLKTRASLGTFPYSFYTYEEGLDKLDLGSAVVDYMDTPDDTSDDVTIETLLGYILYGEMTNAATLGLVESALDENGRPVYKEKVMLYLATYLRNQLVGTREYPSNNNGWRNYSFVTGSSTASGDNDKLYGTDELGRSRDIGAALCDLIGENKGGGSYNTDLFGSYKETISHASELIGSWAEVTDQANDYADNKIKSWWDAAYFLLHNLYVTDTDIADSNDGYGEYEDTYQYLVLPQVEIEDGNGDKNTAYFFDSGYSYDNGGTYTSAVDYDKTTNTITLNGDADGKFQFCDSGAYGTFCNYYPFLISDGNGTAQGESNTVYYLHNGVLSREDYKYTYKNRDYHYSLSGNGYFSYEPELYFTFEGDDDVYLYINGQLVIDIGGTHGASSCNMYLDDYVDWAWRVRNGEEEYKGEPYSSLSAKDRARVDALALEEGGVYSFDFFYMERHGVGSNLRILTNIEVSEDGLDVDKFAYQNGAEIVDNGMVNADEMIEYGFSITNNSEDSKLYNLIFSDPVIGLTMSYEEGLVIKDSDLVTDATGYALDPSDLIITVDGFDSSGNVIETITVSCADNDELKAFLTDLTGEGLKDTTDTNDLYSGDGLWLDATITVRGIYYTMTDAQKSISSFRNYVTAEGRAEDHILRGSANHTVYQPGNPAYYQWAGKYVIVENEQLYTDLIKGGVVDSASDLPSLGDMRLIPSNATGTEILDGSVTNSKGGDVYLKIAYEKPGTYMTYVTILDDTNDSYKLTVPITVYVTDVVNSSFVLDYGLDTFLTDNDALFDHELGWTVGDNISATLMGIADGSAKPGYIYYDESVLEKAVGNTENELTVLQGSYADGTFSDDFRAKLDSSIYLDHTKPWVIEWKGGNMINGDILFSMKESTADADNLYMFLRYTSTAAMVAFGYFDSFYYNYGVTQEMDADLHTAMSGTAIYKLENVPSGDGTNTVHLTVTNESGTVLVDQDMTGFWSNNSSATSLGNWISGKDFTFDYMGGAGGAKHGIDQDIEYLRVYEEGYQLTNSSWVNSTAYAKGLITNNTKTTGYKSNVATKVNGTVDISGTEATCSDEVRWSLAEPVVLSHDRTWEMEFTVALNDSAMLFTSLEAANVANSKYIFLQPAYNMVAMGYRDTDGGVYVNYCAVMDDVDMTKSHTYLLQNRVKPDGSNMVYLTVDGTYIGALDTMCIGTKVNEAVKSNGLSGMDFSFEYIGGPAANGFGFTKGSVVSSILVKQDTALRIVHEWQAEKRYFSSVVATSDGNRIDFTKDPDGVVQAQLTNDAGEVQNGEDTVFTMFNDTLKFETDVFLEDRYSAYVALTIHEDGFAPTPLGTAGVDVGSEVQMYKTITVLPANVVYYEDDFPTINYYGDSVNSFTTVSTSTEYIASGSSDGLTQTPDQDTPYGSDEGYTDDFSNISGDTVHTIAINNDGPLAWFSFTGRGFEIDARTNAVDSGIIIVKVYETSALTFDENGDPSNLDTADMVTIIPLITEFDNGNTIDGYFNSDNDGAEGIYQVPVIRYYSENVDPKNYTVVIYGVESLDYDNGSAHMDTYLHLDGIRIYRPLGADVSEYGDQTMANFEELRDLIVEGKVLACNYSSDGLSVGSGTVTWTEKFNNTSYDSKDSYVGNSVSSVNDYLVEGPNNEVYVDGTFTNGALAFYVHKYTSGTYADYEKDLQIAARAIDVGQYYGAATTGAKANLYLGVIDTSNEASWLFLGTVSSATEQYYEIPFTLCPTVTLDDGVKYHQVVIKVASADPAIPAMVSFTGIKRTSGLVLSGAQFEAADLGESGTTVAASGSSTYSLLNRLSAQMASVAVIDKNEIEPGADFDVEVGDSSSETTTPVLTPEYPSLSLDGEVIYNIYFSADGLDGVSTQDMGLLVFNSKNTDGTIADADDVIAGVLYSDALGCYRAHTNGVAAKNLGDTLYFKVYAKLADGSYVYSSMVGYDAVQYAKDILAGTSEDSMKALVVALMEYGAAAQINFSYKTDDLMDAFLTDEQKALVGAYSSDMVADILKADSTKAGTFAYSGSGFTNAYPTVSFDGAFSINYYITPDQAVQSGVTLYYWTQDAFQSADILTADNASGCVAMDDIDGSTYGYTYRDIAARNVNDAVYIAAVYSVDGTTYSTGVIGYSVGAYCQQQISGSADTAMADLAAATAVYGYYAAQHFAE